MDSDAEEVLICTPPEIKQAAAEATTSLLPARSCEQYERAYENFDKWRKEKSVTSFSEQVMLAYFQKLSKDMKPSSLWSIYSKLRSTISLKNNMDISKYPKLRSFLKRRSDGYKPKKSKTLTSQQIKEFLETAPDDKYLFVKVGLIFGVMGALRREELMKVEMGHIEDLQTALLVKIPDTKTKTERQFVITFDTDIFYL